MPSARTPDGRTIAWEEAGDGPPLLCHPGGPGGSARAFGGLPGLAAERTVLLYDPRGTGRSDRPGDPAAYALEDYAADIEAVREHLGLERLDLLGHSHGGFVAMAWAGAHPDRVGRLVLTNTAPRFTDDIRRARRAVVESYAGEPWFADALAAAEAHAAGDYAGDEELSGLFAREIPFLFPRWGPDERAYAATLAEAGLNADALRHFNAHVAAGMDLRPGLAHVTAPVLVITGALDVFGPSTAAEIAAALPNATTVVVPAAAHFTFAEPATRDAWTRAVLGFLAAE